MDAIEAKKKAVVEAILQEAEALYERLLIDASEPPLGDQVYWFRRARHLVRAFLPVAVYLGCQHEFLREPEKFLRIPFLIAVVGLAEQGVIPQELVGDLREHLDLLGVDLKKNGLRCEYSESAGVMLNSTLGQVRFLLSKV